MGALVTLPRLRSVSAGLLAAGFVAATALTASAAPPSGRPSLSDVQVSTSGVTRVPSAGTTGPLVVSANEGEKAFHGSTVVNLAVQGQPSPSASLIALSVVPTSNIQPLPKAPSKGPLGMGWLLWGRCSLSF